VNGAVEETMQPRERPEGEGSTFVAGLFTGALVGAALAMVLAPASGEEMRDLLRAKAREASNRARDAAGDIGEFATDRYARKKIDPET
jgi:gas vesicle protein